jgi:hypothetical protein
MFTYRIHSILGLLCISVLITACTPELNWRDIHFANGGLRFLLPCQPDQAERKIQIEPERSVILRMQGCESKGMLFTISQIELSPEQNPEKLITQWQKANLSALNYKDHFQPSTLSLNLKGMRIDAAQQAWIKTRSGQPIWFGWAAANGNWMYQWAVYGAEKSDAKTFNSAIQFFQAGINQE